MTRRSGTARVGRPRLAGAARNSTIPRRELPIQRGVAGCRAPNRLLNRSPRSEAKSASLPGAGRTESRERLSRGCDRGSWCRNSSSHPKSLPRRVRRPLRSGVRCRRGSRGRERHDPRAPRVRSSSDRSSARRSRPERRSRLRREVSGSSESRRRTRGSRLAPWISRSGCRSDGPGPRPIGRHPSPRSRAIVRASGPPLARSRRHLEGSKSAPGGFAVRSEDPGSAGFAPGRFLRSSMRRSISARSLRES